MNSTCKTVQNALDAQQAGLLAELIKARPWQSPKYKAEEKKRLDMKVRRTLGDGNIRKLEGVLRRHGLWRD